MSDSQEKSDDLIAELAKLMATSAGSDGSAKSSVIKLPPLNEATIKAAPVRIPGMDAPRPAATAEAPQPASPSPPSSAPAVRIPGMERPAGLDSPSPAQHKPATQFDFGKAPSAQPVAAPEPMSNWQSREQPRTLPPAPPPRPAAVAQLAEMKFDPVKPAAAEPPKPIPTIAKVEPRVAAPAPQSDAAAPGKPEEPASRDGFNFDFGFSGSGEQQGKADKASDPIADLIAAELDAPETESNPAADVVAAMRASEPEPLPNPIVPKPVATAPARPAAVQVKPVSVSPRPADTDRFSVAPVTGFSARQAPAPAPPAAQAPTHPRGDLDPMQEIESLIGEAVRVELTAPEKAAAAQQPSQPAPVVPPLTSGFAPRRSNMRDRDDGVQSAEAAIMAAAAASGAEVGRVDAPASDDRPYKRMKVKPPKTSFISSGARQYVGIAVAGTLLLAAGFGLYWVLGMGRDDPSTAPVLTADVAPAKVEPTIAVASAPEPQRSVVFDEINGTAAVDDSETLVSRDETAGEDPAAVARVVPPVEQASEPGETGETGLANRKVRTVTVRPDGTIVSGDDAVAGTEVMPVDRPNVPEIAGGEIEPSELLTAAVAETGAVADTASPDAEVDPLAALVAESDAAAPLADPAPLEVAAVDPATTTPAVFDGSLVAPRPMPRPIDRAALTGGDNQDAASPQRGANEPASTPLVAVAAQQPAQQAPAAAASRGGAYVQLSSQRSESEAQQSLRAIQPRMNGAELEIRRVDLAAKGIWYRVVLPVNSFQDATQTCAAIKSNGGDCVAING